MSVVGCGLWGATIRRPLSRVAWSRSRSLVMVTVVMVIVVTVVMVIVVTVVMVMVVAVVMVIVVTVVMVVSLVGREGERAKGLTRLS